MRGESSFQAWHRFVMGCRLQRSRCRSSGILSAANTWPQPMPMNIALIEAVSAAALDSNPTTRFPAPWMRDRSSNSPECYKSSGALRR